nr:ribonuclease H-like domain-containing protein [Tanacetum cinerariifolium]
MCSAYVAEIAMLFYFFEDQLTNLSPKNYALPKKMRIEQYFLMTDYSLWEVILNSNSPIPTSVVDGVVQPVALTTAEQKLAKKNELKAQGTLLMALPDKHQLKFNIHKDAKSLMEAIEKRFGGNKETKKASETYQLTGNSCTNESISVVTNVSAASTKVPLFALPNVDNLSDAVIYSFFASQFNSLWLDNDDLKQIDADDLKEMDLKWQMAMLTKRARRWNATTATEKGILQGSAGHLRTPRIKRLLLLMHWFHSVMELVAMIRAFRQMKNQQTMPLWHSPPQVLPVLNENVFEEDIKLLKLDFMLRDNALVELRKKFEKVKQERDELNLKLDKFQTYSKNLSKLLASQITNKTELGYDNQVFNSTVFDYDELISSESDVSMPASPVHDRYKSGEGYHVVPPPYTGTFMPPKPNLVFYDTPTINEIVPTVLNVEPSPTKPNKDLSQLNRPSAPIIEDWVSDSEDDSEVEHLIPAENLRRDIPKSRVHRYSWNQKACFVCKSLTQLIKDYDYYEKKIVQKLVRNHAMRGNHQHYARMTHPHPYRHVVPTTVLTRSRLVPLTAARNVTTVVPQTKVQHQRPTKHGVTKAHSPIRRPINLRPLPIHNNFHQKVTSVKATQGNPQNALKDKEVIDSGGKITSKGKIRTGKLDFEDVYFIKELKFNLFSVSQMVLRENNMYNIDLKNIVPSGDLTCLFTKATLYESNLWHRRLGHINFKTMNKLVKGKFNEKADEGFLVGYSVSSKAFRVFNSRTRIVQETLHINFLENQPNVAGSGPTWLFNIDTLTQSMNYQPVVAGNQPNFNARIQEHFDADKAGEGNVQQYVIFPLLFIGSKDPYNTDANATFEVKEPESEVHVSSSSSDKTKKHDDKTKREAKRKSHVELSPGIRKLSEEFKDFSSNSTNEVNAASTSVTTIEPNFTNNTNTFSVIGPSKFAISPTLGLEGKSSYVDPSQYPDDPDMPALEDITYSDDEDVGAEAAFSNLETNITVSLIPTTRVHKHHPITQIIGDLSSALQTRSMTRMVKEQGGLTQINDDDCNIESNLNNSESNLVLSVGKGVTPLIDHHCCYKCEDSLDNFFCHQYTYEFCGNGAHDGYNCPSYVPSIQTSPSFPQQYPCCEDCGGLHETFQCQPMNYFESNTRYDSNYSGFDQIEPPRYFVNPSLNIQNEPDAHDLFISKLIQQKLQNKYAQPFLAIAITLDLPTVEPEDSLRMGDEHLDTISKIESDEFIKSSVENLVPNPSESKDLSDSECDVPACDDFTTFSNLLFDADDDFYSSDNESFSDENISKKIYSNPLFDEEIISIKIDPHHFNVESDLIESLLNHDSSIISSSSKIDFLLDEFAGELILLKIIPSGIDETDCNPEEEIRLIEKFLYDNSSPHPPKKFISENSNAEIESFYPSPILVEDSNSHVEEIDLSFTLDDLMPPGIEEDDYNCERDMLIFEELLSNDSLSLPKNESFHFDIPSSSRPPAKPPDNDEVKPNSGILTVKVLDDISEHDVPMPILLPTQPTLFSNQEKSSHLLSHRGFKASQLYSEYPMMIYGGNTPILDVLFFHFYPP